MPLRDHLRAHQNVDFPRSEIAQHLLVRALGAHGVAVQARNFRAGKFLAQFFFELFRARAEKINVLGRALRAGLRHAPRKSAVVAFEAVALLVIGQRNAAVLALNARAARPANHEPGISAAIDEDQRLRPFGQARGMASLSFEESGPALCVALKSSRRSTISTGASGRFSTRESSCRS